MLDLECIGEEFEGVIEEIFNILLIAVTYSVSCARRNRSG
jgi:hypothetical protein